MKLRIVLLLLLIPIVAFSQTNERVGKNRRPLKSIYTQPLFQGQDENTFVVWLEQRIVFPEDSLADNEPFLIRFFIDESGEMTEIDTGYGGFPDELLCRQIEEVLESSPVWTPGLKRKKPIKMPVVLLLDPSRKEIEIIHAGIDAEGFVPPKFQGEEDLMIFRRWISDRLVYPTWAEMLNEQGRVVINFRVNKFGYLDSFKVTYSTNTDLPDEVLRVTRTSPQWTPGTYRGIPVGIYMYLPVDFKLL